VKRHCLPWRVVGCGLVLLNILLCPGVASAQLAVNPLNVSFGSVTTGSGASQLLVLSNSGGSSLTVSQAAVTGSGFSLRAPALPITLAPGQSTSFGVTFAPQVSGVVNGSISLSWAPVLRGNKKHRASVTAVAVSLSGTGSTPTATPAATPATTSANTPTPGQLAGNPGSLSFGSVQVGNNQTLTAAITNTGGSSVTLSQATATGSGFNLSGLNLPMTLATGESVTFSVIFTPLSGGAVTGTVSVNSTAVNSTLMMGLAGSGMAQGQLAVTPGSTDFGSVIVGTSKSQTGTLSASGASVAISSASMSSAEFSLSGITLPLTIAAGQSVPFTLTFTPKASGSVSATSSFTSNASNTASESLTGAGTAPPQHMVNLTWDSVSTVVGYNVYRGSQSAGPYAKVNSSLDASTTYTDNSVQAGQTYYYVSTAVDATGAESGYSSVVQALVPTP
jgi:Abnormal spindle-like microcephaly-assoc'd, ASPM-SPD-2-Hydin